MPAIDGKPALYLADDQRGIDPAKTKTVAQHMLCRMFARRSRDEVQVLNVLIDIFQIQGRWQPVVHCRQGISRSAALCVAYLMLRRGLSCAAGFRKVHRARSVVRPNNGFWKQLRDLEAS